MRLQSDPSTKGWTEELTAGALPALGLSAFSISFLLWLPQATMKKDSSHGQEEADCRAELILLNGACTSPASDTPTIIRETNGKPSTPGESRCAQGAQGYMKPGMSQPLSQGLQHSVQGPSTTSLGLFFPTAHP